MPRAFTVNDQPPSRRNVWWGLGCLVSILLVSCAGVIGWLVAVLIGMSPFGGSESSFANRWQSAQERQLALRDAFDGQRQPLNDPDLGRIRRLLDQIAAAGSAADNQAFAELVDFDLLCERCRSYPGMPRFNWLERQFLLQYIRDDSDGPGNVATFDIVHIERVSDDEAVVYVFAKNEDTDGDPFEFMVSRSDGEYRLIDWTRIETGWSEAQQLARMQMVSEDSRINSYENGSSEMLAADDLMEEGDYNAAAERLRKAGQYAVPSGISDLWFYMLARRWSELGEAEECVEACRRAANPGEMPGFYSLEAIWLEHLEEYPEALTAVKNYERAAGFQPSLTRTKAEILEALDRHEDALLCWQRLAEFAPHAVSNLVAYSQALPEPQRGNVLKLVQQAAEPVTVASELAGLLLYHDDEATVALLQQFVNDQAPDSVESNYLQARVFAYQGEDERAAQSYRRAAELGSDAEEQVDYWYCFLDAMVDAGRVVEGYLAMPEATDAFRQLVEGIEWDEAMIGYDDLDELVQAHRERAPDDPWLSFINGLLAAKDDDLEKADAEFQKAEQSGDEELMYPAGSQRRDVLWRQDRLLEAYRIYADEQGEDVFQELADICENGDDFEGLQELIELHRKRNPDDPWLRFYTAVLQKDDQPEAALAILKTIGEVEDDALSYRVRWMQWPLEVELGRWRAVYENSDEPEDDFRPLLTALKSREDWVAAEELCQLQRERFPQNPSGLIQSVDLATTREDDAEVVRLLTPWPEELELAEYQANSLHRQLSEALVELGRADEALARAREFADTEEDYEPLMIVLDRTRRWTEFGQLLDDLDRAEELRDLLRYRDFADFFAFRTDPAAADLRRRVPPSVPTPRANYRVVLMGTFHAELTADRLQDVAGREEGIEIRPLPTTKSCVDAIFEVRTPQAVVLVAAGSEGYCDPQFLKELRLKDSALRQVLENHRDWLQVQGIEAAGKASPATVRRLVRRLAAGLYDPGVQAIYVWEAGAPAFHFVLADNATAGKLGSSESFHALFRDAPELYLAPCFEKDSFVVQEDWDYARQSELREFARSAVTDSDQRPHLACLSLRLGPTSERIWVRITSAEHTGYGQFDLQGQLTSDSVLWPHLKRGESVRFYSYQVLDWKVE